MFTFADHRTDTLIYFLRAHPEGVTLREIAAQLSPLPPHRTLQRWIAKLVRSGEIERRGGSKYVRYFPGPGRVPLQVKKRTPKPIVPKPPEPSPEPSRLPSEYQRLFDRLAPKIIRLGYVDDDARSELAMGFCRQFPGVPVDDMNAFLAAAEAEFDALKRATALAKYDLTPDNWSNWRQPWCDVRGLPPDKD
jgi:hypothetical protein